MNYPFDEAFLKMMQELLKDEYEDYLDVFNHPSYNGLRINTNKISVTDFLKLCPFNLRPIPWSSDGFYYDENDNVSKHPFYYAGLYYLQEPSAMLPAEVLNAQKGDIVLDACAAPGGKSTKIGTSLNQSGLLLSNDISPSRANALLKNIERFGFSNSYVTAVDLKALESKHHSFFDKILIDAPCSGEGMFRKDPSMLKNYKNKSKEEYINIQKSIVDTALNLLKDDGEIVYSTCTFDIQENEAIIEYMLQKDENLVLLPIELKGVNYKSGIPFNEDERLSNCIRLYPHLIEGEGHFIAHLKRRGKHTEPTLHKVLSDKLNNQEFDNFMKLCSLDLNHRAIKKINDEVYLLPEYQLNHEHLRILRSGLLLGSIKNQKFEPSQALALALKANEFKNVISLDVDDMRVIKYLKGETIDVSDLNYHDGYNLICVKDYPLGFSKINGGIFKNKLQKGWIYQ